MSRKLAANHFFYFMLVVHCSQEFLEWIFEVFSPSPRQYHVDRLAASRASFIYIFLPLTFQTIKRPGTQLGQLCRPSRSTQLGGVCDRTASKLLVADARRHRRRRPTTAVLAHSPVSYRRGFESSTTLVRVSFNRVRTSSDRLSNSGRRPGRYQPSETIRLRTGLVPAFFHAGRLFYICIHIGICIRGAKKAKINSPSKMSKNLEVSMVIPHGWSCLNKYLLHKTSVVLFDGKY